MVAERIAVEQESPARSIAVGERIQSVDLLRGLVIALMALDHVRDFFHVSGYALDPLDPAQTTPLLYATRWITHLCAPTFVMLAGVSAYLQFARGKDTATLSRFLLTRGLWLVALELTVIGFGWSFWVPWMIFLQVIWAIGWSMVGLAALVWLPRVAVLAIGIAIVAGHNLLDPITPEQLGGFSLLWQALHAGGPIIVGGQPIGIFAYPILPWFGIMAFGYGLGAVFLAPARERDRTLLMLGAAMIAGFLALRFFNHYGDPAPWSAQSDAVKTAMVFLDVQKYPPSLDYALATLGIMLFLTPALERLRGPAAHFLRTFGAVPLFAYVLHIYLAHALTIIAHAAAGRSPGGYLNLFYNIFVDQTALQGNGFPLPVTYLAWALVLAILYPLCRWWGKVKRTRRDWWLSYF